MGYPRTRSSNNSSEPVPCTITYDWYDGYVSGGTYYSDNEQDLLHKTEYCTESKVSRSMTDVVTPEFQKQVSQGKIINNPMVQTTLMSTDSIASHLNAYVYNCAYLVNGAYEYHPKGPVYSGTEPSSSRLGVSDSPASYPSVPAISVDTVKNLAITQAHANVDLSEAQILATVAEGKKSVYSLVSIFKRACKIWRAINRYDLKALRKEITPKELSDRYMEARYAIRPLIYDIQQITGAVTAPLHAKRRFTFRGYSRQQESVTERVLITNNANVKVWATGQTTRTVEARAGVLTSIDTLSPLNLWGVDQPVETMWELAPFSFIADWFFNIGQTIASFTPEVGTRELASWVVVSDSSNHVREIDSWEVVRSSETYDVRNEYGFYNYRITLSNNRTERFVSPSKSFVPKMKIRLNTLKLLDLAIIIKNLGGNNRRGLRL